MVKKPTQDLVSNTDGSESRDTSTFHNEEDEANRLHKYASLRHFQSPISLLVFQLSVLLISFMVSPSRSFVYQNPSTVSAMDIALTRNTYSIFSKPSWTQFKFKHNAFMSHHSQRSSSIAVSTASTTETTSSNDKISCSSDPASPQNENNDVENDTPKARKEDDNWDCNENNDEPIQDDEEEAQKMKIKASMARNLLSYKKLSNKGSNKKSSVVGKKVRTQTSVGPIKGKGRNVRGSTAAGKILSTVRKNAAVAANKAEKERNGKNDNAKAEKRNDLQISTNSFDKPSDPTRMSKESITADNSQKSNKTNVIKSTIHKILQYQEETREQKHSDQNEEGVNAEPENAGSRPVSTGIGLFGDKAGPTLPDPMRKPFPGTILSYPSCHFLNPSSSSYKKWKKTQSSALATESSTELEATDTTIPIQEAVTIRVATRLDDRLIANLRLSVFANYNTNSSSIPPGDGAANDHMKHIRDRFRVRSCQVLESRRNLGAICLIASVPKVLKNEFVAFSRNKRRGWRDMKTSMLSSDRMQEFWQSLEEWEREEEWVMGSVECSIHEFYGTSLGRERVKNGILYITEVAVSPDARMIGVGKKLLQGVDKLAHIRNVETLYLHVDVTNEAAIRLYTTAGYKKVEPIPVHKDFTRSLNLHDGASNGRRHFLLYKHLRTPTILTPISDIDVEPQKQNQLGFQMPS